MRAASATTSFVALVGAAVSLLLSAGCAGFPHSPQPEAPQLATPTVPAEPAAGSALAPAVAPTIAPASQPALAPASQPISGAARQAVAQPAVPPARVPAKVAPSPVTQIAKQETPTPPRATPPAAPPLDLKSLETRLKETRAIGVFTKLTLKNQIDDLLDQFRAYYQGRLNATLAELRRSYDRLLLKVLALLQDADPPLAVAIASSRESIWAVLSNPAKFATV